MEIHYFIMNPASHPEHNTRNRALPAVALGLAAILGLQVGAVAADFSSRISKNTVIIAIAGAPAPIAGFDTNTLMIWTAATLAVLLLMSRRSQINTAPLPIFSRSSAMGRANVPHRQSKLSIRYHTGGLYGP